MDDTYEETGGLRWGETFMRGMNASWPFAKLRATRDELRIDFSGLWRWPPCTFFFARTEIQALRKIPGVLSDGIRVEHDLADFPPFVLFWTFRFKKLKARLEQLGYVVLDS